MANDFPEATAVLSAILETLEDAVIRVGASANCYDMPADANSGAAYVATRVRTVIESLSVTPNKRAVRDDFKRFYFLDSHGEEPFMRVSDHERLLRAALHPQQEQER